MKVRERVFMVSSDHLFVVQGLKVSVYEVYKSYHAVMYRNSNSEHYRSFFHNQISWCLFLLHSYLIQHSP